MGTADAILGLAAGGRFPGLCWLDGGDGGHGWLGTSPDFEIEGDDLALLERVDRMWQSEPQSVWLGWLTYDLGSDALLGKAAREGGLSGLVLRRYPGALELAGERRVRHGDPIACDDLERALAAVDPIEKPCWLLEPLRAELAPALYRERVERARAHVIAGDTYQVNVSQSFSAAWDVSADSLALSRRSALAYGALRCSYPAKMGGLVSASAGAAWILSNSPETLLDVRSDRDRLGGTARSWPIKGTRARDPDPERDAGAGAELLASAKDGAEHVMIVDLVRNDLGRLAVPGTVVAPPRPKLVSLATVHHLVSEVRCTLRPRWNLRQLVEAVFPGGSVTGAPKRRTMEIIAELEQEPRGIYCGALLVLEPGGLRLSIPIRTGVCSDAGLSLRSGGGIVVDSEPEAERLETIAKARAFNPRD